jgi:hypothetical protein
VTPFEWIIFFRDLFFTTFLSKNQIHNDDNNNRRLWRRQYKDSILFQWTQNTTITTEFIFNHEYDDRPTMMMENCHAIFSSFPFIQLSRALRLRLNNAIVIFFKLQHKFHQLKPRYSKINSMMNLLLRFSLWVSLYHSL